MINHLWVRRRWQHLGTTLEDTLVYEAKKGKRKANKENGEHEKEWDYREKKDSWILFTERYLLWVHYIISTCPSTKQHNNCDKMRNIHDSLRHLNTWSPINGTLWEFKKVWPCFRNYVMEDRLREIKDVCNPQFILLVLCMVQGISLQFLALVTMPFLHHHWLYPVEL